MTSCLGEVPVTAEEMKLSFPVNEVMLWNTECPALYEIKTELIPGWRNGSKRK